MNRQVLAAAAIAVAVVGVALGLILYSTRNNAVGVVGDILKVRTHPSDAENTLVALDFRLRNPSTQQFVVREVEVFLDPKSGEPLQAMVSSEIDARRLFDYYKVLGPKYNDTLVRRDKINSGESIDRGVLVSFSAPEAAVNDRKALRLVIHDVDGTKSEILEKRQ